MHQQPRRKRQKDLMRPEAELYRAAGWLGRGFHVYILFLWPLPLVSLSTSISAISFWRFISMPHNSLQQQPFGPAQCCVYTALLCDNAAVLLENI
jgi:hypothetical protein